MRPLLIVSCALLAAGARADSAALATTYTRTNSCDDGILRPKGVVCAPVPALADAACPGEDQIMALLHGCYFCVDRSTCLLGGVTSPSTEQPSETSAAPIPTATAHHKVAGSSVAMSKASNNVRSPATGTGVAVASQDHAESTGSWAFHLSNWVFAAPVALAMIGVGVALRKRAISERGHEFERLQEDPTHEINPFCASVLAQDSDDGELEFVDEEQKEEEADEEADDDEDCDDDGADIVVARSILDDIDEEDEELCL